MPMRMAIASAVVVLATLAGADPASAGAKDESAAEWLPIPQAFKDWRDSLADKGLSLTAAYVGDNIGNITGGISRGAIHFGRLDVEVDADLEKITGWAGAKFHAN